MTIDEAIEGVQGGLNAVRSIYEGAGANDGAFREAMARLQADMVKLEETVRDAQTEG